MRNEVADWLESVDDDFMAVVHAMVGTYVSKQQEAELTETTFAALPTPPWAKQKSQDERNAELIAADAECDRGEFVTLESLQAAFE